MHQKMMAYDRVISELSSARVGNISYPVVHAFLDATRSVNGQVCQIFLVLNELLADMAFRDITNA